MIGVLMGWINADRDLRAINRKLRRIDRAAHIALRHGLDEDQFYQLAGLEKPVRWPAHEGNAHGRAVSLDA